MSWLSSIASSLLSGAEDPPEDVSGESAAATAPGPVPPQDGPALWDCVWEGGVRVRSAPHTDGKEVGSIEFGERVLSLESEGAWVRHEKGWTLTAVSGHTLMRYVGPAPAKPRKPSTPRENSAVSVAEVSLDTTVAETTPTSASAVRPVEVGGAGAFSGFMDVTLESDAEATSPCAAGGDRRASPVPPVSATSEPLNQSVSLGDNKANADSAKDESRDDDDDDGGDGSGPSASAAPDDNPPVRPRLATNGLEELGDSNLPSFIRTPTTTELFGGDDAAAELPPANLGAPRVGESQAAGSGSGLDLDVDLSLPDDPNAAGGVFFGGLGADLGADLRADVTSPTDKKSSQDDPVAAPTAVNDDAIDGVLVARPDPSRPDSGQPLSEEEIDLNDTPLPSQQGTVDRTNITTTSDGPVGPTARIDDAKNARDAPRAAVDAMTVDSPPIDLHARVQASEARASAALGEIEELRRQLAEAQGNAAQRDDEKTEISSLRRRIDEQERQIAELRATRRGEQSSAVDQQTRVETLESRLEALETAEADARAAAERAKSDAAAVQARAEAKVEEIRSGASARLKELKTSMDNVLEAQRRELEDAQRRLSQADASAESQSGLEAEIRALNGALQEREAALAAQRDRLAAEQGQHETELKRVQDQATQAEQALAEARKETEAATQRERSTAQQFRDEKERAKREQQRQDELIESRFAEKDRALADSEARAKDLAQRLAAAVASAGSTDTESAVAAAVRECERKLKLAHAKRDRQLRATLRTQFEKKEKRIVTRAEKVEGKLRQAEARARALEAELAAVRASGSAESSDSASSELQRELNRVRAAAQEAAEAAAKKRRDLNDALTSAQAQAKDARAACDEKIKSLSEEARELKMQLGKAQAGAEARSAAEQALNKQLHAVRSALSQEQEALDTAKAEADRLRKVVQNARDQAAAETERLQQGLRVAQREQEQATEEADRLRESLREAQQEAREAAASANSQPADESKDEELKAQKELVETKTQELAVKTKELNDKTVALETAEAQLREKKEQLEKALAASAKLEESETQRVTIRKKLQKALQVIRTLKGIKAGLEKKLAAQQGKQA